MGHDFSATTANEFLLEKRLDADSKLFFISWVYLYVKDKDSSKSWSIEKLVEETGFSKTKVQKILVNLKRNNLIEYQLSSVRDSHYFYLSNNKVINVIEPFLRCVGVKLLLSDTRYRVNGLNKNKKLNSESLDVNTECALSVNEKMILIYLFITKDDHYVVNNVSQTVIMDILGCSVHTARRIFRKIGLLVLSIDGYKNVKPILDFCSGGVSILGKTSGVIRLEPELFAENVCKNYILIKKYRLFSSCNSAVNSNALFPISLNFSTGKGGNKGGQVPTDFVGLFIESPELHSSIRTIWDNVVRNAANVYRFKVERLMSEILSMWFSKGGEFNIYDESTYSFEQEWKTRVVEEIFSFKVVHKLKGEKVITAFYELLFKVAFFQSVLVVYMYAHQFSDCLPEVRQVLFSVDVDCCSLTLCIDNEKKGPGTNLKTLHKSIDMVRFSSVLNKVFTLYIPEISAMDTKPSKDNQTEGNGGLTV